MDFAQQAEAIKAQEHALVFDIFDEHVAFALGAAVRERALRENLGLVCDIRLWDRPLFFAAMPGTTGDNQHWVRRKVYVVQRVGKSSLRAMLDNGGERLWPSDRGHAPLDYALHGGAFPIKVRGIGTVGAMTISGLKERDDHAVAVAAICGHLGFDAADFPTPMA